MAIDTPFVRGADKLKVRLDTIRRSLDISLLLEETKDLIHRRTIRRFEQEVDPDGKPWAKLKASSLRRKARKGAGDRQILVQTGAMKKAIKIIRGGVGSTFTNVGAGFRIGIQDPQIAEYARVQNRGYGSIPKRRFLGIGALDIKAVDSLLRRKATAIGD